MRKPRSQVSGDIDRHAVIRFAGLLAVPVQKIIKSIFDTHKWPSTWKLETVTLIPKKQAPDSPSQVRNISCTPFFCKVVESFLLDYLKGEVKLTATNTGA